MHHFWLADSTGRLLEVSSGLCGLLGYRRTQLLEMTVADFDRQGAAELSPGEHPIVRQAYYTTADSSQREVEYCCHFSGHNGGQYHCFVRELPGESKGLPGPDRLALLQTVLDAQSSSIVLFDANRQVVWHNRATRAHVVGGDVPSLVGRHCKEMWPRCRSRDCVACPLLLAFEHKEAIQSKISLEEGRRWRVTAIPVKDDDDRVQYLLFVGNDITEFLTVAEGVRQNHKLESLGTLAGGIAHDFNNILSGIIGYTELAQTVAGDNAELRSYLDELVRAGKRATELVRQILTFSRGGERRTVKTELPALAEEVLQLLRSTLPTTIELEKRIDVEVDPILADPVQMHQIILNLCTNAAHAMETNGGRLKVEIGPAEVDPQFFTNYPKLLPGKYLRLMVEDTGCGMNRELMAQIFDPYFTTKPPGQGTGLGLSVVHGIVKECGGHITVDSQVGEGSVFTVFLPTVAREVRGRMPDDSPVALHGEETIMVVDDEPVILEVTKTFLELHDYTVVVERNSQVALERFRREPQAIDLLITDVTMPHLPGDRLAKEFLAIRPDLPIIMMTGYSDVVCERAMKAIGIRALATKPLTGTPLLRLVRQVLDGPE